MPRTVLLEHRLEGGDFHIDWLIDRDERSPLLTFRLPPRAESRTAGPGLSIACPLLSTAEPEPFTAERIGDHRRLYLDYEGPISGGRGSVRRVAEGQAEIVAETGDSLAVRVRFGEGPWRIWKACRTIRKVDRAAQGAAEGADLWIFDL